MAKNARVRARFLQARDGCGGAFPFHVLEEYAVSHGIPHALDPP